MSIQNRLMSVLEIDEEAKKTTKMTTPLRPKQPIPTLPCRVITPNEDVITWFQDGYIEKKNKNGDSETWVPIEICSVVASSFSSLSPSGHVHVTNYTTETSETETEGEVVNYHMMEVEDREYLCWVNDCKCFTETTKTLYDDYETSRCDTLGFHVGAGDCPICGYILDDSY